MKSTKANFTNKDPFTKDWSLSCGLLDTSCAVIFINFKLDEDLEFLADSQVPYLDLALPRLFNDLPVSQQT